ncbi:MAG TPA: hypothetical protein VF086_15295 [Propionibacteriaceae bacterium]
MCTPAQLDAVVAAAMRILANSVVELAAIVVRPDAYTDFAAKIMRVVARGSVELTRLRASKRL